MAEVTPSFTLKTHQDVVVKVAGEAGSTATIDLDSLIAAGQIVDGREGAVKKVDIAAVTWTGHYDSIITISRNGVVIMTLPSTGANFLNFNGQDMPCDNIENESDVDVSIAGAQGEVWLRLRKVAGYRTTIEPEQFGPYDDPTKAGE